MKRLNKPKTLEQKLATRQLLELIKQGQQVSFKPAKSKQKGYSDLPLFFIDNQTKLF
jgi:hypothetical protein